VNKSSEPSSNKGCVAVGGIIGVLLMAAAVLMGVFWMQARQENEELRKRLQVDDSAENQCQLEA